MAENVRRTTLGSPCSPAWSDDWIHTVDAAETQLGRRICGARTIAGNPCPLEPNHTNGRCKFHGGFDLTGAPKGNRNAIIHGLYSRRLRPCSPQCTQWADCPCASPSVAALPPADRPICPYEQLEYNTALTDLEATINCNPNANPFMLHIAHDIALLRVMLNRASITLRDHPQIDNPENPPGNPAPESPPLKGDQGGCINSQSSPSSNPQSKIRNLQLLSAYLRLFAEYRRSLRLIAPRKAIDPAPAKELSHKQRAYLDTDLAPDHVEQIHPTPTPPPSHQELAEKHMTLAREYAAQNQGPFAVDEWELASQITPQNAREWVKELIQIYHPPNDGRMGPGEFECTLMQSLPSG